MLSRLLRSGKMRQSLPDYRRKLPVQHSLQMQWLSHYIFLPAQQHQPVLSPWPSVHPDVPLRSPQHLHFSFFLPDRLHAKSVPHPVSVLPQDTKGTRIRVLPLHQRPHSPQSHNPNFLWSHPHNVSLLHRPALSVLPSHLFVVQICKLHPVCRKADFSHHRQSEILHRKAADFYFQSGSPQSLQAQPRPLPHHFHLHQKIQIQAPLTFRCRHRWLHFHQFQSWNFYSRVSGHLQSSPPLHR